MTAQPPKGLKPVRRSEGRAGLAPGEDGRPEAEAPDAGTDGAATGPARAPRAGAQGPDRSRARISVEEGIAADDADDPIGSGEPEGLPDPALFAGLLKAGDPGGDGRAAPGAAAADFDGTDGAHPVGSGDAAPPSGAAGHGRRRPDPAPSTGARARAAAGDLPAHLAGIEVTLSVEIGRARLALSDLMAVEPGQLFDLDTLVSEPVSILVNGRPFATGEVLAVGDRFGVRILALAEPSP